MHGLCVTDTQCKPHPGVQQDRESRGSGQFRRDSQGVCWFLSPFLFLSFSHCELLTPPEFDFWDWKLPDCFECWIVPWKLQWLIDPFTVSASTCPHLLSGMQMGSAPPPAVVLFWIEPRPSFSEPDSSHDMWQLAVRDNSEISQMADFFWEIGFLLICTFPLLPASIL